MSVSLKLEDFTAWIDLQPGAGKKLIVKGKVIVPNPRWTLTLTEAAPQGTNGAVLILDLEGVGPEGEVIAEPTKVEVRFEKPDGSAYTEVTIRYPGGEFTIPVGQTH